LDMFAHAREADDSIVLAAGVPAAWFDQGFAVRGLDTPGGVLAYALRREEGRWLLEVDEGLALPAGGLVLPWPQGADVPGLATINGETAGWEGGELRIRQLPARVEIAAP